MNLFILRRACLSAVMAGLLALTLGRVSGVRANDDYQPKRGQPGKDVMWLPTGDELALRMLETARVGPDDLVFDLGAGDGKIAIAAAQRFGARAVGIEYNPRLVEHAQQNVVRAGVADRVRIIHGDIFKEDFSSATVLTLYLLDELNQQLRPQVLAMRPGTRVVSNSFAMGDWEPDAVMNVGTATGYYWRVPAPVAGTWAIEGIPGLTSLATVQLQQRYQRLAGHIVIGGKTQPLLSPQIDGATLTLRYLDESDLLRAIAMRVAGDRLDGEMVPPYGMIEGGLQSAPVTGRRLPR